MAFGRTLKLVAWNSAMCLLRYSIPYRFPTRRILYDGLIREIILRLPVCFLVDQYISEKASNLNGKNLDSRGQKSFLL